MFKVWSPPISINMDSRILVILLVGILLTVGLLAFMSYASLDFTQYGLDYAGFSKTVRDM